MSQHDQRYDDASQTLWLYREYEDADTLVPRDELMTWSKIQREGVDASGNAIKAVSYVFQDAQTASYNSEALAFASLGVYVGSLDAPEALDAATSSFAAREDFGI